VCSIEKSNDETTLSFHELQSKLLVQEQHMKSQSQEADIKQALKISNGGRGYGCGRGRSGSRRRGSRRSNKDLVEFYKSHKLGKNKKEEEEEDEEEKKMKKKLSSF